MDSVLRPRDIQSRIRSGETPETVAAAAQTSVEKVMTYAGPVLAERAYVAQQAQRASVRRRTGEGAPGQLGAAVAERLAEQRVDPEDVEWDAWRRDDGRWTLVAAYAADGAPERAEFVYDTAGRYVTATDERSRWLVGERVTSGPSSSSVVEVADDQLHLGDDAIELVTGRRPEPVDEAPQPDTQPQAERDEVTVDLTEPAAAVRPLRAAPTAGAAEAWFDTQASDRPAPRRQPEPAPEPVPEPEPVGFDALFEVPTAEAEPEAETAPAPRARKPAKKGRAAIPSWDEIMFGSATD